MFGIPEKEIRQTLANVDTTLAQVRRDVLPQVNAVLVLTATILGHLAVITAVFKNALGQKQG